MAGIYSLWHLLRHLEYNNRNSCAPTPQRTARNTTRVRRYHISAAAASLVGGARWPTCPYHVESHHIGRYTDDHRTRHRAAAARRDMHTREGSRHRFRTRPAGRLGSHSTCSMPPSATTPLPLYSASRRASHACRIALNSRQAPAMATVAAMPSRPTWTANDAALTPPARPHPAAPPPPHSNTLYSNSLVHCCGSSPVCRCRYRMVAGISHPPLPLRRLLGLCAHHRLVLALGLGLGGDAGGAVPAVDVALLVNAQSSAEGLQVLWAQYRTTCMQQVARRGSRRIRSAWRTPPEPAAAAAAAATAAAAESRRAYACTMDHTGCAHDVWW